MNRYLNKNYSLCTVIEYVVIDLTKPFNSNVNNPTF